MAKTREKRENIVLKYCIFKFYNTQCNRVQKTVILQSVAAGIEAEAKNDVIFM